MMQISKKWKKILLIGLLAKFAITILLFVILFRFHEKLNDIHSHDLLVFSNLQRSLEDIQGSISHQGKADKIDETLAENRASSKIQILKSIGLIRESISNGSYIDLNLIKPSLTPAELSELSNAQDNVSVSDLGLSEELKLCLKYIDANTSVEKQPDRIIIEKFIEVEEEDKYKSSILSLQLLSNSIKALDLMHYDIASHYLDQISQQSPVHQCIQGASESIKARISISKILTSLEKRILNDK